MTETGASSSAHASQYRGPKDVGRADSLYQSARTKADLDYAAQLLFSALIANPEHELALATILAKTPELAANRKKVLTRIADLLTGSPADEFVRALALYAAMGHADQAVACVVEAQKVGLFPQAAAIAEVVLKQLESGEVSLKPGTLVRLADALEAAGAYVGAVRAVQWAVGAFPNDAAFKEREKNLLARKYLKDQDLSGDFRENLQDRARQQATHRAVDPALRLDEMEQHYRQTRRFEDFKELIRALRDAPAQRREAALPTLQEGFEQFGEKEILWFIREIKLQRRWSEVRLLQKVAAEDSANASAAAEYEQLRREVLREEIDHLYEIASSLPPGPDRQKREIVLTHRLFEAGRYEEAIKQAQILKRKSEARIDAWVIMAKSFVQLGLALEAAACFESILRELGTQDSPARVLDAKYSYAEFLTEQAGRKSDPALAAQARRLCAEVILEDIDYREIRALSARAEALTRG